MLCDIITTNEGMGEFGVACSRSRMCWAMLTTASLIPKNPEELPPKVGERMGRDRDDVGVASTWYGSGRGAQARGNGGGDPRGEGGLVWGILPLPQGVGGWKLDN